MYIHRYILLVALTSLFALPHLTVALVRPTYCTGDAACANKIASLQEKGTGPFKSGDELIAYIRTNKQNASAAFFPLLDEYSLMEVPNSYNFLRAAGDPAEIWVDMGGVSTTAPQKVKFFSADGTYYLPQLTVIAFLRNGNVSSLIWDTGCTGCGTSCVNNQFCGVKITDASATCAANPTNCNLRVFLGFSGTDSDGIPMTSAGKRLSLFRAYGANWAVSEAVKIGTTVVKGANPGTT